MGRLLAVMAGLAVIGLAQSALAADDAKPAKPDPMQYELRAQESLRDVIRQAVRIAQYPGLPEGHALYITFNTKADGVKLPPNLLAKYPGDMTVILQWQYIVMEFEGDDIIVDLWFDGQQTEVTIPYAAISRFYDEGSKFGLAFDLPRAPLTAEHADPQIWSPTE